jgi:hypothetical protein
VKGTSLFKKDHIYMFQKIYDLGKDKLQAKWPGRLDKRNEFSRKC